MQECRVDSGVLWKEYFCLLKLKKGVVMNLREFDGRKISQLFAVDARLKEDAANPHRVDGVYPMTHGETYDTHIMKSVADYHLHSGVEVMYCDEPPTSSVRGGDFWRETLVSLYRNKGVLIDPIAVMGARYQDKGGEWRINSFTEARPVIEKALDRGMTNIEIVALPFHILRCFIGFATECLALNVKLNVFARVTRRISWIDAAIHSQGTQTGTAVDFAQDEIDKILFYTNLAPPSEVLRYLDERDARIEVTLTSR